MESFLQGGKESMEIAKGAIDYAFANAESLKRFV